MTTYNFYVDFPFSKTLMRRFKYFFWGFLFIYSVRCIAQDTSEFIDWSAKRRLAWNDFEAPVNKNSDAAANTSTYLGLEYNVRNNVFNYKVACRFSKNKSWGLVKNEWILRHEQGHFDITEIFARTLHKAVGEYKFNKDNYRADLDKIYKEVLTQKEQLQSLYDRESDYSRNKEKQEEWLRKIGKMLEDTREYAEYNYLQ